jgi:hypothetical protein
VFVVYCSYKLAFVYTIICLSSFVNCFLNCCLFILFVGMLAVSYICCLSFFVCLFVLNLFVIDLFNLLFNLVYD